MATPCESNDIILLENGTEEMLNKEIGNEEAKIDGPSVSLLRNNDKDSKEKLGVIYGVDDNPGWMLSLLLGFQQFFTLFGGSIVLPFVLASVMCFQSQPLVISEVMCTLFFVYGISTLMQNLLGVRLPIIQGGSFSFVGPTTAILNLPPYRCVQHVLADSVLNGTGMLNTSLVGNFSHKASTEVIDPDWKLRMNVICGSLMVASIFQLVIGFSGVIGWLLRFIGPLTTSSVITLVGLHLYPIAVQKAGVNWIVSGTTVLFVLLFTLYLGEVSVPIPLVEQRKLKFIRLKIFKLFPLILAVLVGWSISGILTRAGVFPEDPLDPGFKARTDAFQGLIEKAKWIRFPYPGQWGTPTVKVAAVVGTMAGIMCSIIESVGDYYACAAISGAPPPPKHAVNRGIGIEGIGCILSGALGGGNGVTSFSENIAAIGITRVASRRVILCSAGILIATGICGKLAAIMTTIPAPVIGGIFLVLFGLILAVGISNLQMVDMKSARNLSIFGLAILAGMGIPYWTKKNVNAIKTGSPDFDQILTVLLTTEIIVGGFIACFLDNTAPGSLEERGIRWPEKNNNSVKWSSKGIYELPGPLHRLHQVAFLSRYMPFMPDETEMHIAHEGEKEIIESDK